jgi:hypothetical protein
MKTEEEIDRNPEFWIGILIALVGSFVLNFTVTATYRYLDLNPVGNNLLVALIGWVGFFVVVIVGFQHYQKGIKRKG